MTQKEQGNLLQKEVDHYIQEVEQLSSPSEKLEKILDYMQKQLSHGQVKPLSRFWKMREYCLKLFKENLALPKRIHLWEVYQNIVTEIVKLKEVLTEKSLYHKEEIEKAADGIQKDLENLEAIIASSPKVEIPHKCNCLEKNRELYETGQRELNIINNYAKQLNALKNEVAGLEMPYRERQELLNKLHTLSDLVFPRRRELLANISKKYCDDIHYFTVMNFEKKELKLPLFDLKDQIKALQGFAKVLSLNVNAFSQTREKLSQCWDKIRAFEKEQKKIKEQQKATCNENEMRLHDRIERLKESKADLSKKDFDHEINSIDQSIKQAELQKPQRMKLKDLLSELDETSAAREEVSKEEDNFVNLQRELLDVQEKGQRWDFFTLHDECKRLQNIYKDLALLDVHQNKLTRSFFNLKTLMMEKLFIEVENCVEVEEFSTQVEEFRQELKGDMEVYRRALNTSNQSIEKAMLYNELLTQTKHKLQEFEKKIKPALNDQG